jgi:Domain of unknown function (DUF4349)
VTMLDEDRLSQLLDMAGDSFEVPAGGPDDIVARVRRTEQTVPPGADRPDAGSARNEIAADAPSRRGAGRLVTIVRRHGLVSAAACLAVALLAAGAIAIVAATSSPGPHRSTTASGPLRHAPTAAPSTTTTLPRQAGANGDTSGSTDQQLPSTQSKGSDGLSFAATAPAHGSAPTTSSAPTTPALPSGAVGQPAKIEQTGTVGLRVPHGELRHAMAQLSGLAVASGGFVASSQTQSGGSADSGPTGAMTLQVPVGDFDTVLAAAQRIGTTTSLSTKATDVTGQDVDLQSRLVALQASRQQYLTIMGKATTIGDVLAVQTQLDTIQGQIEQIQGQLSVLGGETTYSSVTVDLSEAVAAPAPPSPVPGSGIVGAWHDSVSGFLAGVDGMVRVGGPLLFALVCLAGALVAGRTLWRRYQRHRL